MKVSVAMPTYKRLPQLKRAVADVFAQTFKDWELIISDDEVGEDGETWRWLNELAENDSRVKILKNTRAKHGQIYNVNSACLATQGEWIKPFFDDDRMLPNCLEEMVRVAEICKEYDVVMVGCRAQKWRSGVHVGDDKDFTRRRIEVVDRNNVLKAMCLQDNWNGRTPTHVLMKGDVVRGGATMVEDSLFKHPLDVRWFSRVLEHGAMAFTNRVLVCECQGEVASGTSELWKEEPFVTEELRRVYAEIQGRIQPPAETVPLRVVDAVKCGTRGLYHITKKQYGVGCKYLMKMLESPTGVFLTFKWLLRQRFPGYFTATRRISVER